MSCMLTRVVPSVGGLLHRKVLGVAVASASRHLSSTGKMTVDPSVAGEWYNELGSKMVVSDKTDAEGQFTGVYHSKVGEATKQYPLVGRYDVAGNTTHGTMGFTVQWHNAFLNSKSVTTWSGQRQLDAAGQPCILTTWLLTSETAQAGDWASTMVGTNVFTRDAVETSAVPAHLHCSHPADVHK